MRVGGDMAEVGCEQTFGTQPQLAASARRPQLADKLSGMVLVTGAAGFIGAFLCKRLLETTNVKVVGFDNLNDYYDVGIKHDRLRMLARAAGGVEGDAHAEGFTCGKFIFVKADLADEVALCNTFERFRPSIVVNLAAQAGVRYSIENPRAYINSNIVGFFNVLECCRNFPVKHLVYASSSSVYGANSKVPYSTDDKSDSPVSLYAATKKSNELMAHAYSKLYGIPTTGLRFFTVYGPMGRPDMAYFKFTNRIVCGESIQIYNMGDMKRDFTYIDDIVSGVLAVMVKPPLGGADAESACAGESEGAEGAAAAAVGGALHAVYNIGNSAPEDLLGFVETLERVLVEEGVVVGSAAHELLPMQPGDVYQTYADVSALERDFGFRPTTPLEEGLRAFARWYKQYYCWKGQA